MKKLLKRCLSAFLFVGMVTGAGLLSSCGGSKTSTSVAPSTNASTSTSTSTEDTNQLEFVNAPEYIYVDGTTDLSVKCGGRNVTDATITFTSSDVAIATVVSSGRVTGVSAGEVTITAAADGYLSATHTLTVRSTTQNITISITPAFTDGSLHKSVQTGYGIFFAYEVSADTWSSAIPAVLNQDTGAWDVTLENMEFGQNISYNTYYAKTTGQGWDYINTESSGGSRSLEIVEGTLSYPINSTFEVPKTVESVEYIITLSIGDGETINDGVFVYVSTRTNGWSTTAKATLKEEDGTYRYTDSNVGIAWEEYRICLGYESGLSWSYQYPASANGFFQVTESTTSHTVAATFDSQPPVVSPDAEEHVVTFGLLCSDSNASDTKVVYDTATTPNDNWKPMTKVADGEFTYTTNLVDGTYYFFFYTFDSTAKHMYADVDSTAFEVVVNGEDIVIGVSGTFATGIGSIVNGYVPTPAPVTYAVTFILKLTDAMPAAGSTSNTNVDMGGGTPWKKMTYNEAESTFTYTENLADNTYWFRFVTYGTEEVGLTTEESTWFSIVVSGAATSITVEGSFATGIGSVVTA